MQTQSIQSIDDQGRGLILTVTSTGDRFGHSIEMVSGWNSTTEKRTVVLSSLEGSDDQDWPASPPWQDFSIEERGAEHVLLAVGMAGKSHWSASVATQASRQALEFDIACQVSPADIAQLERGRSSTGGHAASAIFVGSTYRLSAAAECQRCDQSLSLKFGQSTIEIDCVMGVGELADAERQWSLVPLRADDMYYLPLRWKYTIRRCSTKSN